MKPNKYINSYTKQYRYFAICSAQDWVLQELQKYCVILNTDDNGCVSVKRVDRIMSS